MRIFVVLLISMSLATANPLVVLSGNPPATVATYEGFETTTSGTPPTNWLDLDSGTGASDWHYTTSPIVGTASLFLPDSSSGASEVAYDFPEDTDGDLYLAFKYKVANDPASATSDFLFFTSSVPADLAKLRQQTNGGIISVVDATNSSVIADLTPGTVYRFKIRYNGGTGTETMETWIAAESDGAFGSSLVTQTGSSTARAGRVKFSHGNTHNQDKWIDNVKVSTSDIAWSDID